MLEAKSFTDMNGKRGKIGSRVQIFDFYDKQRTDVICEVTGVIKQGNGTYLNLDIPPMPHRSEFYKSHPAKMCIIIK